MCPWRHVQVRGVTIMTLIGRSKIACQRQHTTQGIISVNIIIISAEIRPLLDLYLPHGSPNTPVLRHPHPTRSRNLLGGLLTLHVPVRGCRSRSFSFHQPSAISHHRHSTYLLTTPLGVFEMACAKLTSQSPWRGSARRTSAPAPRAPHSSPRPGTYMRPRKRPRGRYVTTSSEPSHSTDTGQKQNTN